MSAPSASRWFDFALRLNGVEFPQVSLRWSAEYRRKLEVVVRDCLLGIFALHEEFALELPENQGDKTGWRHVSLGELQVAAAEQAHQVACDPASEPDVLERREGIPNRPGRATIERLPVDGDSSHLDRACKALRRAGIRFRLVGGLGSHSGHVTLAVCSLTGARTSLGRAGFLESLESKYVLLDSRTGWKLRLLKARYVAADLDLPRRAQDLRPREEDGKRI